MTMMRSQKLVATPKSCVIMTMLMFRFSRSFASRVRICICTVTSRAVVGSSAIRSRGSQAIAIAIIARWRMPPENSCG